MTEPISIVLFSGTADKLHAAGTIAVGAAVMDQPVNVLLMYWALDAFRSERINTERGLACDAELQGASKPVAGVAGIPWLETFRQAKDLGDVTITACAASLQTLGIDATALDPLVDSSGGIAAFLGSAEGGQILFI
jgi:peroxiredoxin family protein